MRIRAANTVGRRPPMFENAIAPLTPIKMADNHHELWESDAEARILESRLNGFWNPDYFTNILLPLLDLKPGNNVLDVGAGTGALTLLLARHLPEVHFTGVDIIPALVEDAVSAVGPGRFKDWRARAVSRTKCRPGNFRHLY